MAGDKTTTKEWAQDNRDLLVELKTQMSSVVENISGLRTEVKDIKDGMKSDIEFLKSDKISRSEAVRINTDQQVLNSDHETRIRFIERYGWMAWGAMTVISFAISYFHPFTHN